MIARLRREAVAAARALKRDRETALRAERNQCKARAERAEADLAEVMLERDVLRLHVARLTVQLADRSREYRWHPSMGRSE